LCAIQRTFFGVLACQRSRDNLPKAGDGALHRSRNVRDACHCWLWWSSSLLMMVMVASASRDPV
jgi:hypothetical protein